MFLKCRSFISIPPFFLIPGSMPSFGLGTGAGSFRLGMSMLFTGPELTPRLAKYRVCIRSFFIVLEYSNN